MWGAAGEMLSSPRLDNQSHCYTGLMALLQHSRDGLQADAGVSVVICFDHEEIGSESAQGAGSPVMSEAVSRVLGCFDTSDEMLRVTVRKSFLISADVAHAIHPNYPDKHEKNHQPVLNKGTVIKTNQNQRYATNAETGFLLRELARRAEVPVQVLCIGIQIQTLLHITSLGICCAKRLSLRLDHRPDRVRQGGDQDGGPGDPLPLDALHQGDDGLRGRGHQHQALLHLLQTICRPGQVV